MNKRKRATGTLPIVVAAAAFSGAEAMVNAGITLPGSESLPWWLRALGYFIVMGGGFGFRWWAMNRAGGADHG